jgi:hypothetical protein
MRHAWAESAALNASASAAAEAKAAAGAKAGSGTPVADNTKTGAQGLDAPPTELVATTTFRQVQPPPLRDVMAHDPNV